MLVPFHFSALFTTPPHIDPLAKVEPQRPVKEEEPKTAGDLDQEAVRAWLLEGGWTKPLRRVD